MVSVLLTNKYGHFVIGIILLWFNRCIIQSIVYYSVDKTESAAKNIAMRFPFITQYSLSLQDFPAQKEVFLIVLHRCSCLKAILHCWPKFHPPTYHGKWGVTTVSRMAEYLFRLIKMGKSTNNSPRKCSYCILGKCHSNSTM